MKIYEKAELNIIEFEVQEIITESEGKDVILPPIDF
jgi:hypothetical protein